MSLVTVRAIDLTGDALQAPPADPEQSPEERIKALEENLRLMAEEAEAAKAAVTSLHTALDGTLTSAPQPQFHYVAPNPHQPKYGGNVWTTGTAALPNYSAAPSGYSYTDLSTGTHFNWSTGCWFTSPNYTTSK